METESITHNIGAGGPLKRKPAVSEIPTAPVHGLSSQCRFIFAGEFKINQPVRLIDPSHPQLYLSVSLSVLLSLFLSLSVSTDLSLSVSV